MKTARNTADNKQAKNVMSTSLGSFSRLPPIGRSVVGVMVSVGLVTSEVLLAVVVLSARIGGLLFRLRVTLGVLMVVVVVLLVAVVVGVVVVVVVVSSGVTVLKSSGMPLTVRWIEVVLSQSVSTLRAVSTSMTCTQRQCICLLTSVICRLG